MKSVTDFLYGFLSSARRYTTLFSGLGSVVCGYAILGDTIAVQHWIGFILIFSGFFIIADYNVRELIKIIKNIRSKKKARPRNLTEKLMQELNEK